jgi:hypothetical protein
VSQARFYFFAPAAARATAQAGVTWRLLAINNRDLGRAPTVYRDLDACVAAVRQLQEDIPMARVVTARTGRSAWGWRICVNDSLVAVSSRDYQRRIQSDYAGAVLLRLVPGARVPE